MTERINVQQVAWLVESEPDGLWWDGRFVSRGIDPRFFTRDPNEAIRFARREDAEKVASSSSALKATEHIWLASQPQQAPLKERPDFVAGYDAGLADGRRIAEREQAAQPVAPVGWLYDWTHSSATGRPDERFTSFTADEVYAFKGMGHENVRPVYAAAQPQQATEGSRLSDLRGLLADAQPKQPNGQA